MPKLPKQPTCSFLFLDFLRTVPHRRYNLPVALRFMRILEWLPLAAVVQQWLLCCGNMEAADRPKLNALRQLGFSEGAACLFVSLYVLWGGIHTIGACTM